MSENILELKSLSKVFFKYEVFKKRQTALDQVSANFPKGKCTGLLGHNGAGKTTTIRMILGLVTPDKGEILFDGEKIGRKHRAKIGYMPEVAKLPGSLTALEVIRYQIGLFGGAGLSSTERKARIERKLAQVGLWDVRHKMVKSLSKGMGRRLAWAQATIHEPHLVILDEPFSGLDPLAHDSLLSWIKDYKKEGKSILLCSHELPSVQELCDEMHIFKRGKVVFSTLASSSNADMGPLAHSYKLTLSGVRAADLNKIQTSQQLKPWQRIDENGFTATLYFKEYNNVNDWLKTCASQGIIVSTFTDGLTIDDSKLRELFDGGQLQ